MMGETKAARRGPSGASDETIVAARRDGQKSYHKAQSFQQLLHQLAAAARVELRLAEAWSAAALVALGGAA